MIECALYLVATPIGNLGDMTQRAMEVLAQVDFVAAEDTRVTQKLFSALGLPKKPMVSYYEHNKHMKGEAIAERVQAGESCALVTDAGMPAISDPGEDLVVLCAARGIPVVMIPGACAAVSALAASALPTGRFCFEGFLSVNKKARRAHLDSLRNETRTMIFYEAPHKLKKTLADLAAVFGEDRQIAICRELTKLHEEILRVTLGQAIAHYDSTAPRGEFVLVLAGAVPVQTQADDEAAMEHALAAVHGLVEDGVSKKDAVKQVSERLSVKKNALYQAVLLQEQQIELGEEKA